ncbi:pyrroline-5-carboxylate reductase [Chroococcidiopsis sp. TS-821]|uniref:pyrroline-5-carboxylate reductase n=1 Tax=Chroococcidiopsis sp. TS-821 TaxID=1378066 RepID=UPI000CEE3AE6|nr:pyrroline-5-carboxylate reductase [Chroococcidiopsis sp. TS-821]PPS45494.1 pyrroline-5-carboxylate reductase [Chroococcidiopsis sp. TS-821]
MSVKLGMIGGGVMGEALLSRLISQNVYQPTEVIVGEKSPERRDYLAQQYGVSVIEDNRVVAQQASTILLAIKPQVFAAVTAELGEAFLASTPLIVSILAGVSLSQLETAFPQLPVIRAMPNTPATVGAGMTAFALGSRASARDKQTAQQMFSAVGEVVEVPETLMDAVTGLSGSGPAYVALLVEALSDGGVAAGLPRAIATQLALQTVRGTVQLLQETKMHPAELKDRVTSPGGTTIAGVTELERGGFRAALIAAVKAAALRSQELGAKD